MTGLAPILVIGAHRSGTSALSRVLEELGVFVGHHLDPNHEAIFFLRLNDWLLEQAGGRWDRPDPVLDLIADSELRDLCVEYLDLCVRTPRAVGYLGAKHYLRYRRIERLPGPWGFKDPRSCFTLPFWLDLFPDARVVHIHRHGVDVAKSLLERHRSHLERSRASLRRNRRWLGWLPKRAGFGDSVRCGRLESAFSLWEDYVRQARRHVDELGDRALEITYEDLAGDATEVVAQVARFCQLEVPAARIEEAARLVRSGRASAHVHDPTLAEFATSVEDRVAAARGVRGPGKSPVIAP